MDPASRQPQAHAFARDGGAVDFRLARDALAAAVRAGRVPAMEACDAHPELVRAASHHGVLRAEACPVCGRAPLRDVTYVFGPRLPAGGRCISADGELERLAQGRRELAAYVVEVCLACSWNHLMRMYPVRAAPAPPVEAEADARAESVAREPRGTSRSVRGADPFRGGARRAARHSLPPR
jgi:hypothetical protein